MHRPSPWPALGTKTRGGTLTEQRILDLPLSDCLTGLTNRLHELRVGHMYVVVYSPQSGRMGTRRARTPAVGPGRRVGRTVSTGSRVGGVTDGRHGAATPPRPASVDRESGVRRWRRVRRVSRCGPQLPERHPRVDSHILLNSHEVRKWNPLLAQAPKSNRW